MSRTPADYSMQVVRGATWEDTFDYTDETGMPIDLTGFEARMQVRTKTGQYGTSGVETLVMELTTQNGMLSIPQPEEGQIILRVDAADTLALNPDNLKRTKLVHSVELYIPASAGVAEYVIPLLKGGITVYGETTR